MKTDQQLYDDMMALVADPSDAFYFQDFTLDSATYRIFNYRLASYTLFLLPSALECRGIMFEVAADGTMKRIAARPQLKFFNLNENPMTMNLDLSQVDTVEAKADGSLMSTFMHEGKLRLKSRGSLFSEQAIDAMKWLDTQPTLLDRLLLGTDCGWTINLEWCAPHNRIVIGYDKPHLKVLNARNMITGEYQRRGALNMIFDTDMIGRVDTKTLDVAAFVQSIPAMQDDIEGYVCRLGDLWFKVKTDKYMSLHHAKDSINNPRRLFEAVIDEGVDDLRSMFAHDAVAIQLINEMQDRATAMYNKLVRTVEDYYTANKGLERKDYAIKAQTLELHGQRLLGLAMNLYIGRPADYKEWMKSHYKELGFRDTALDKVAND